ncbi:cation:proton antiporter domain-containing protein [Parabacteroides distasonis]|uniref:cation:proton antiporter domain-containing protein n=1 Tax=Parabacteroides distasonis TaxID=823 RepID=UPI003F21708D
MSEIAPLISDLAVILIAAGIITLIFKCLKQPVVLGYIVAGILAGPAVPYIPTVSDPTNIKIWADIGVIFLLFAMGLEFSFKKLMTVGGTAVIASITIVSGMMFLGYTTGNALGFSHLSSIFLGGMLSMSSTAIVFKAFDDMGLRGQKFTGVVLGVLVVEDLVAVVLMVLLSTLAVSKQVEGMEMLESILKLGAFLIFWSLLGIYLIPSFLKKIKPFLNDETLLIIALGFCLGMVMIAAKAGFSSALGAFVMGSLLAETIEVEKIEKLVKPVKDLFAAIFFVSVGMMIQPDLLIEYLVPICILTILVIIGQIFFGSLGVLLSGQPLKIALQSGFSLTQIGEFAFIIASLGVSLKVTDDYLYPVIVAVSVVTTFLTPYMIRMATPVYQLIDNYLPSSIKLMLNRYSSGSNTVKHKSTWNKLLKSMLLDVILYTVLTIFSIIIFFTYVNPIIRENILGFKGALLSLSIILAIILPFLWAIIMKKNHSPEFLKLWNDSKFNRGPLVSLIAIKLLLCASILMPVIVHIFNVASGVGFIITLLILLMIILSKKLKKRSLSIEKRFIDNFNGKTTDSNIGSPLTDNILKSLPFNDLHLMDFVVGQESSIVGRSLKEINFRQKYGINIVSIIRGERQINIPRGEERLYPFDKIIIVGTDEELDLFQEIIQKQDKEYRDQLAQSFNNNIKIEQFNIEPDSPLIGRSIQQSDIRDKNACLILGIERDGKSMMNPPSQTVFKENDNVWVAGEYRQIVQLSEGLSYN